VSGGPELLLVVGVGRSGTSLLTRLLGEVGFHIPQPEVEPDKTNPRGFGEPQWVVDFHMELMDARGMTVFDGRPKSWETTQAVAEDPAIRRRLRDWLAKELERAPYVVIKDPRVSWFQSLWRGAAGELGVTPSFVTTLRHPAEIVASAKHWYGPWQTDASRAAGWLNVMLRT